MVISPEWFVCFWSGLQIWKEQSFNLTIDTEAITQLLKSKFEQPKFTWRHQCHAFCQKGNFSLKMSIPTEILDHEFSLHSDSTFYNYLNFIVYLVPDFILANIYIYIYIYILYIYYVYILYIYIYIFIYIYYIYIYISTHKYRYRYIDIMSHSSEKYLTPAISCYSLINSFAPLWEKILSNPFYCWDQEPSLLNESLWLYLFM